MRSSLLSIVILLLLSNSFIAQKTNEDDYATSSSAKSKPEAVIPFRDRLVFGGSLGGYFGNPTYLQVNPMIGYRTTPWWINGIGVNYIYTSIGGYSENIYGGSIWTRAYILKALIAHSEFEVLRREASDQFGNSASATVPVWLVGAGYNSGGRIRFSAMIMYDLIQDPNSPYNNPIIRLGGLFGF
jgi:hypothetical protein